MGCSESGWPHDVQAVEINNCLETLVWSLSGERRASPRLGGVETAVCARGRCRRAIYLVWFVAGGSVLRYLRTTERFRVLLVVATVVADDLRGRRSQLPRNEAERTEIS